MFSSILNNQTTIKLELFFFFFFLLYAIQLFSVCEFIFWAALAVIDIIYVLHFSDQFKVSLMILYTKLQSYKNC